MRISNKELKLKVPENKYLPSIQDEIRSNLTRLGVDGLSIDLRYDVRSTFALVRFTFKGKHYEMKVGNQKDVRANMWAINKRIEYKARMHILGIETFDISASPYLLLENKSGNQNADAFDMPKAAAHAYAILGVPEYAGNEEIKKKYSSLMKAFHPDMALSTEAREEFSKRCAEINQAYTEIKKERGI